MSDREHRIPPTSRSVHEPRVGELPDGPWMAKLSQRWVDSSTMTDLCLEDVLAHRLTFH